MAVVEKFTISPLEFRSPAKLCQNGKNISQSSKKRLPMSREEYHNDRTLIILAELLAISTLEVSERARMGTRRKLQNMCIAK